MNFSISGQSSWEFLEKNMIQVASKGNYSVYPFVSSEEWDHE
jgi:hypothetical protein